MSALSILYFVLPFPLAFILHDGEEVAVQHRWMNRHGVMLTRRFPKMRRVVGHLRGLDTRAFAIAALEELLVIVLATCYVLIQGSYCMEIWSALFIAFSVHLLVHVCQAVMVRGYVPGLVTSLLLLPYAYFGMESIWYAMSGSEIVLWGTAGVVFMVLNLLFAHRLGQLATKR